MKPSRCAKPERRSIISSPNHSCPSKPCRHSCCRLRPPARRRAVSKLHDFEAKIAYRQSRWPAHKDLATDGPDEVGNRKTVVPDAEKWGARFEELVQMTGMWER
jgi:hypothetical protein